MQDTREFHITTNKLRGFFLSKGFIEVPTQGQLSILSACEDPRTISKMEMGGLQWPLPQTGQMNLELELLKNPDFNGVFCLTTSYRNESNPIPGRHLLTPYLFEFEAKGDMKDLKQMETEILEHMGFDKPKTINYDDLAAKYGVDTLENEHEERMCKEEAEGILLQNFPTRTNPFWNMKYAGNGIFKKVDVILGGMETIGSAERSCDKEEMEKFFYSVENGEYAQILFEKTDKQRVLKELDEYLSLDFFPRYGGGIGVYRMCSAMRKKGLFSKQKEDLSFIGAFRTSVDQLST
jgi:aspartyl/asparaginyl-tRNA synthetase